MTASTSHFARPVRCVIIGAGGYSGAELAGILLAHPHAQLVGLFASARREKSDQPGTMADLFPRLRGLTSLEVKPASIEAIAALQPDAIFLATPHEASVELAPQLLATGAKVFDLSVGFRLSDLSLYPKHYGFEHTSPALLGGAVYGLVELNRTKIQSADLVAVPGCYPTSAILPLAPLVRAGAIRPGTRPIVDSASGVSGAGRGLSQKSLFCEVSLQAYNVFKHRHTPEISEHCGTPVLFTPHLVALDRGILSTIHVELDGNWSAHRVAELYRHTYGNEAFIRLLPAGQWPAIGDVTHTNFCDIASAVEDDHLIISSAIDNLVKGAAGQAVQCMNVRFGLPETAGLLAPGLRDHGRVS